MIVVVVAVVDSVAGIDIVVEVEQEDSYSLMTNILPGDQVHKSVNFDQK